LASFWRSGKYLRASLMGGRDVDDHALPVTTALADGGDECRHAAERETAHLLDPLQVDLAGRVLEVLGVWVGEDHAGEVLDAGGGRGHDRLWLAAASPAEQRR
jgi:hypothetical protein